MLGSGRFLTLELDELKFEYEPCLCYFPALWSCSELVISLTGSDNPFFARRLYNNVSAVFQPQCLALMGPMNDRCYFNEIDSSFCFIKTLYRLTHQSGPWLLLCLDLLPLSSYLLKRSCWPPFYSAHVLSLSLPQGLCTCYSLCIIHSLTN